MSSRRTTLKRPIVCKSAKPGDCGDCELLATCNDNPCAPNAVVTITLGLHCDVPSTSKTYLIKVRGAFEPLTLPPSIDVETEINPTFRAPGTKGIYTVYFDVINKDRCLLLESIDIEVN